MAGRIDFFTYDHSGEKSAVSFYTQAVTNLTYNDRVAENDDLKLALEGITLTTWGNYDYVSVIHSDVGSLPASPYAQREIRAIFDCVSSNGKKFQLGIPCPDMNNLAQPGTDAINLLDAQVAAYIATLVAEAVAPDGGAINVVGGTIVGRNN